MNTTVSVIQKRKKEGGCAIKRTIFRVKSMNPVLQEEKTGCAIASTALLAGVSYKEAKEVANGIGIFAGDKALWSKTAYIRQLLAEFKIEADKGETPFTNWDSLPDYALLSINWHLEEGKPFWHWVVFVRKNNEQLIYDSSPRLESNTRINFDEIHPKWFIGIQL